MNNGGDVLARGESKAQFAGPKVSQEKWDAIWNKQIEDNLVFIPLNSPEGRKIQAEAKRKRSLTPRKRKRSTYR